MKHYLRSLYLVKSDPDLLQYCMQNLDQYCKTLCEYTSCNNQSHHKNLRTPQTPATAPRTSQPRVLWISDSLNISSENPSRHITFIHAKHYRQILGQEFSLIIYDVSSGVRANPWYAVIGTLQLGGTMLLLTPSLELAYLPSALPMSYIDSVEEVSSVLEYGYPSHFNRLFADLFSQFFPHQIMTNTQQLQTHLDKWLDIQIQRLSNNLPESVVQQLDVAISEQAKVGTRLIKQLMSDVISFSSNEAIRHKSNIHVLQADRGRGKSDLLGQMPMLLLSNSAESEVTSPTSSSSSSSSKVIFNRVIYITQSNEASHTIRNGLYRFHDHLTGHENRTENIGPIQVRFCSPDDPQLFSEFAVQDTSTTLLLIDEAASLPVYWLQQAVAHYSSIVFATTTHGYENNGMGFSLTFLPSLPHYTTHQLTHPIRFVAPCPVEKFAQTLLSPINTNTYSLTFTDGLHMLTHQQLMSSAELRRAVMECLMEAHYQTAPDDLQRLLDAPDMQCGVYIRDQELIGCIWIVQEGQINDEQLQQRIAQGTRRVNGHLSLQQLAYTYGVTSILNKKVWRINRIAVLPQYQHSGDGTQILAALLKQAKLANIHMITSAFGASERLLRFWQKNDYKIVKLGQQINSVTGLVNAIVILPIAPHIPSDLVSHIQKWHTSAQDWHALLNQANQSPVIANTGIYKVTSAQAPSHAHTYTYTEVNAQSHVKNMLIEFLDGCRSFDYVEMYIYWYVQNIVNSEALIMNSAVSASILTDRYIHGHSLNTIMTHYQLANKKAVISAIKSALQKNSKT